MEEIPTPLTTDSEDVSWALETASALWRRQEKTDAVMWLRRAAQAAGDVADDSRALWLARRASELADLIAAPSMDIVDDLEIELDVEPISLLEPDSDDDVVTSAIEIAPARPAGKPPGPPPRPGKPPPRPPPPARKPPPPPPRNPPAPAVEASQRPSLLPPPVDSLEETVTEWPPREGSGLASLLPPPPSNPFDASTGPNAFSVPSPIESASLEESPISLVDIDSSGTPVLDAPQVMPEAKAAGSEPGAQLGEEAIDEGGLVDLEPVSIPASQSQVASSSESEGAASAREDSSSYVLHSMEETVTEWPPPGVSDDELPSMEETVTEWPPRGFVISLREEPSSAQPTKRQHEAPVEASEAKSEVASTAEPEGEGHALLREQVEEVEALPAHDVPALPSDESDEPVSIAPTSTDERLTDAAELAQASAEATTGTQGEVPQAPTYAPRVAQKTPSEAPTQAPAADASRAPAGPLAIEIEGDILDDSPLSPPPPRARTVSPVHAASVSESVAPLPRPSIERDPEPPTKRMQVPAELLEAANRLVAPAVDIDLDDWSEFADLPEDQRKPFLARAKRVVLAAGSCIDGFALAVLLRGEATVALRSNVERTLLLRQRAVIRSRGTSGPAHALRLTATVGNTEVLHWDEDGLADIFAKCPWVEDEVLIASERHLVRLGAMQGALWLRFDSELREQLLGLLETKSLEAGETLINEKEALPGLVLVAAGQVELCEGGVVRQTVGAGEFLYATEVLMGSKAPLQSRAGADGALVLVAERSKRQTLLVDYPLLLEILGGM